MKIMRDYSILDNLIEGVQIIDRDMRYVYLNKILLQEIRLSESEVIGYKMEEKFPGIEQSDIYQNILLCMESGESQSIINEFRFPDGRHTFYEIKIQSIEEGAILFSRDITRSLKGEKLLQESNKQLEHFVYVTAHDMREPIRRMSILSEELLIDYADALPEYAATLCQSIHAQSSNLMTLINDLRTLSGIKALERDQRIAHIKTLAKESLEEISFDKRSTLPVAFPERDAMIRCYPSLVKLLFRNLFANAFKYGEESVRLIIEDDEVFSTPIVTIANKTSHTLPDKDIFLPFVKGKSANGTGLGLSTCKKIIDLHNGKIWQEMNDNDFRIHFKFGTLERN